MDTETARDILINAFYDEEEISQMNEDTLLSKAAGVLEDEALVEKLEGERTNDI